MIPREAWVVVNDLHLYVSSNTASTVSPGASRTRFLERVIAEHQRLVGILAGTMSRDEAYTLLRLGRHVERADMTTRVLDVRAGCADWPSGEDRQAFDDVQWTSVLRSLSALQMYHRTPAPAGERPGHGGVRPARTALPPLGGLCLASRAWRASAPCRTPRSSSRPARRRSTPSPRSTRRRHRPSELHAMADDLQRCIGALHERLTGTYFRGSSAPS